jgi:hypothetical protein
MRWHEDGSARHLAGVDGDGPRFWITLVALIAVLVGLPLASATLLDLDGRTPLTIAQATLYDKYGLRPIDEHGKPIPENSGTPTVSEFSLESGATTKHVPFALHGRKVLCEVHVPNGDPSSVTATCQRPAGTSTGG